MKKILLTLALIATTFISFAQEANSDFNRWSVEIEAGIHKPTRYHAPGYYIQAASFGQASVGVRYMFNNKFGVKVDFGANRFEGDNDSPAGQYQTNYYRWSLQGVVNASNVLGFNKSKNNRFGILLHGGGGYARADAKEPSDRPGADSMLHIMAGITPQYRITDRIVLTGDLSSVLNVRQTYTWDGTQRNEGFSPNGFLVNASVGITFYLGNNEKHADWIDYSSVNSEKLAELEERLSKIETDLIDTDQDGVADYLDREANTISGVAVNTKGIAIDRNENGIPDELEPSLDNRYVLKSDYKGGSTTTNYNSLVRELLNEGYVNVYFKTGSTAPQTYSLDAINYLKVYMKKNPTAKAQLIGYADEIGNEGFNSSLSANRAKKVYDILIASGVDASRLSHTGNGEDTSVDKSSQEARQLVRRVTFKLD